MVGGPPRRFLRDASGDHAICKPNFKPDKKKSAMDPKDPPPTKNDGAP
jgi:hypothetical protein